MENKEQMLHVAKECGQYDYIERYSKKTCLNCSNNIKGACVKGVYEDTLMTIE